jgi:hypothetical protein
MVLGPGEAAAPHEEGAEFLDDSDGADLQAMVRVTASKPFSFQWRETYS